MLMLVLVLVLVLELLLLLVLMLVPVLVLVCVLWPSIVCVHVRSEDFFCMACGRFPASFQ